MTDIVEILGCSFKRWTTEETLLKIEETIRLGKREYLCTVNVAILIMMRDNPRLAEFITNAGMTVADGQPLIWTSRLRHNRLPERVTGVELVPLLAEMAQRNSWGIYLMGATREIVGTVAENLRKSYPGLEISGADDGYFDSEEAINRAKAIRRSGAKILIVAMGVPRQEYFIEEQWENLGVNFAVGVGGSFDVISGVTKRAPRWMQKAGLEWFFRTMQEPRRLFMRYLTTNTRFLLLLIMDSLSNFRKNKY